MRKHSGLSRCGPIHFAAWAELSVGHASCKDETHLRHRYKYGDYSTAKRILYTVIYTKVA